MDDEAKIRAWLKRNKPIKLPARYTECKTPGMGYNDAIPAKPEICNEYVRLWQAALLQAVEDMNYKGGDSDGINAKHNTLAWFSPRNRDFRQVCEMAGYEPESAFKRMALALERGFRLYVPKGKGARYLSQKAYRERVELKRGSK